MRDPTTRMDGDPPPHCKVTANCRASVLRNDQTAFVNLLGLGCLNSSGAALLVLILFMKYNPE